jgi:opacity protein-like surface antigen
MNKKLKALVLAVISSLGCSAATPYIGGSVGYLVDSEEPIYGGKIGVEFAQNNSIFHSVEGEVLYSTLNVDGVRFDLLPLMLNYRLGASATEKLYFNFGGGIGASRVSLKYYWVKDSDTAFTYQLLGTIGYRLTRNVAVEGNVRYLNIGSYELVGVKFGQGDDASLELGLKYRF